MTNIELAELLLQYPEMPVKYSTELGSTVLFDLTVRDIKQADNSIIIDIR